MPTTIGRPSENAVQRATAIVDRGGCYIDGAWEPGRGKLIAKVNPATGELLAEYAGATSEQVDRAVGSARRAHDRGRWARSSPVTRSDHLHALADMIEANYEMLLDAVMIDVGTPISWAGPVQLDAAIAYFRWFAEAARRGPDGWYKRGMTADVRPRGVCSSGMLVREPIGVVAAMTAYNVPYILTAWKVAAALAAGCPIVMNPSPRATLSTMALFDLITQLEPPKLTG